MPPDDVLKNSCGKTGLDYWRAFGIATVGSKTKRYTASTTIRILISEHQTNLVGPFSYVSLPSRSTDSHRAMEYLRTAMYLRVYHDTDCMQLPSLRSCSPDRMADTLGRGC